MSEILALMTPEGAERLTVELANRASAAEIAKSRPIAEDRRQADRWAEDRRSEQAVTVNATLNAKP